MTPKRSTSRSRKGFTLAAVLVVMAAILLLSVGVLAVVGIERKTARSYVDVKRAEWIARAGVEQVRTLLREEADNDDFLIFAKPGEAEAGSTKDVLDYLYLARGEGGGEDTRYTIFPLFTADEESREVSDLDALPDPASWVSEAAEDFQPRKWGQDARVAWIPVEDDDGRLVGRYAMWVEDLQAKIDGRTAGNDNDEGKHARAAYPLPAPGVDLDETVERTEVAAFALDPQVEGDVDTSQLDDRVIDGERVLISPESILAAAEFQPPLERDDDGRLEDLQARAIEESMNSGTEPYFERPTVPFAPGIDVAAAGQPKLNLNALLAKERESAISDFAEWVETALPEFEERKGGFPDNYLKTLAANAFDYADEDSDGTVVADSHRGLDAYPLVSEHLVRFRWEDIEVEDGRKYLVLSGTVFAELWNMSDQPVSGEFEISYETNYSFDLGVVPDLNLGSPDFLEDPDIASPQLKKEGGYYWLPAQSITLEPNQYKLINCGKVVYTIDSGPSSVFIPSPIALRGEDEGEVGYRMKWNGTIVDQARGNVKHPDLIMNYPRDTQSQPRQGIWTTIPGHSYSIGRFDYVNNMGDPRIAYYVGIAQDPNDYPDNYSPNRRTIRWGNVYFGDSSTKPKVYGRVMPSEWPDCGHNTSYGYLPPAVQAGRAGSRGDERIDPDDPQFFRNLPDVEPLKAPMRISNRGRFFSATELGRVYDPVMWVPTYDRSSDTAQIRDGRMPSSQTRWPLVELGSPVNDHYGGGNSLRIGRPEHPRFVEPGLHAAHLLDLFHTGVGNAVDREDVEGNLAWMEGRVNLNTAGRDALRALAVGLLQQDPELSRRLSNSHRPTDQMAPPIQPLELGTPAVSRAADVIADAIIRERPIVSAAQLAAVENVQEEPVFGNEELYSIGDRVEWSDSAAEEVFARVYNSSTLRSRNFRVWVVGQALTPLAPGSNAVPEVLAESRKVFNVFADPGERLADGGIDSRNFRPVILHENDF
ncbi:hypothetical protein HAHE_24200 [Haloferula helveola]|uniref:Uncharacterized protein n=1 Tax=Haloferula helveola TaxID=490095 RepID=A0ABM7RFK8_9BACT|nr:hypothetical protein HAHE_24200 [Haloferula helveola]